ncbi:MAG: flavin reductase family protein [Solirubrobacteraceae bacterium]
MTSTEGLLTRGQIVLDSRPLRNPAWLTDRFAGLNWELGPRGMPLLTDALVTLECEIVAEHPAGDHWIVVGHVNDARTSPLTEPLVFFAGAFGTLR